MAEDFNNVYEYLVIKNAIKEHTVLDLDKITDLPEKQCRNRLFGCLICLTQGKADTLLYKDKYVIKYRVFPGFFSFRYMFVNAILSFKEIYGLTKEETRTLFAERMEIMIKTLNDLTLRSDDD